ncbi:MAG: hypothetical protein EBT57_08535, partial [Verrucomicrobia bacterium]|nr:hypothetical protein [Verrucomicrobiota bacterium]
MSNYGAILEKKGGTFVSFFCPNRIRMRGLYHFEVGGNYFGSKILAMVLGLGIFIPLAPATELGSTKVTAVRNVVEHNDGAAKKSADVGQTVTAGQSVMTKDQSLAELVADDSSVIRLGSHSVFSYSSKERMVKLDKGTMLMHTPAGNGGATIESGGVTGAISGTTFMLTASP